MIDARDFQTTVPQRFTSDDDWFEVLIISDYLFAISEPRHYEHTVIYLLLGSNRAILIDTGCGIGNLRRVVEQLTTLPVTVVNTHTHLDHLGSNHQFSEILMFDHPRSRNISSEGAPQEVLVWELLRKELVTPPWPHGFRHEEAALPPFKVSRWLKQDDVLEIGDIHLRVLYTPGEAPDHICLLDQTHRILFSGDILLNGPVWSHLDGGDVSELQKSYELLMRHYDEFDVLMPGHNAPCQHKGLLPIALAASEEVLSGKAQPQAGVDLWGRHYNKYEFGRISILSK
ncbi:MBL fold metallo-hydrolase [Ensifer sp. NM-2]|uniref:MBL fold metallo-hydrolase n=1 Tax=Ensifer sp. NM-2 TaxID=2109730 RepID=UPI000D1239CC|nr:MBL fold metallo-hydrolase [Ensifer sp. NM-2]PSS64507.1 MBL fold metallo-hydrolase [Ensifer sp. NM-2]